MKSLAELDELREKLCREMNVRGQEHDITVKVSMGTCGIAAGAREIVKALLEELGSQGINNVALTQTSCAGLCHYEPLLEVALGGEKTTYVNVDQEKAKEIVRQHLKKGEAVKKWTMQK